MSPWESLEPEVLRSLIYRFIRDGEKYPLLRFQYEHRLRWDMQVYAGLLEPLPGMTPLNPVLHAGNVGGPKYLVCLGCQSIMHTGWQPQHFLVRVCQQCSRPDTFIQNAPFSFSTLSAYWKLHHKEELLDYLLYHQPI